MVADSGLLKLLHNRAKDGGSGCWKDVGLMLLLHSEKSKVIDRQMTANERNGGRC